MVVSLRDKTLWVNPNTLATEQAEKLKDSNPAASKILNVLGKIPTALWVGPWNPWTGDTGAEVDKILDKAAGQLVVFVIYNIPNRDLGNYSSGGAAKTSEYKEFIDKFSSGIQGRQCVVIAEPDALPHTRKMSGDALAQRYECLNYLVDKVSAAGGLVYLDVGDSGWCTPDEMVSASVKAGILRAQGIVSNVAHYRTVKNEHIFCRAIIEKIKKEHNVSLGYFIDSGRAGRGPYDLRPGEASDTAWCNNPDAGIGARPALRLNTSVYPGCQGLIWCKGVLASDGEREGAPKAGQPYVAQAIRLYWRANPPFPPLDF